MTQESLQQLYALFDHVMDLPPVQRRAELDALKAKGEPLVDQLVPLVVFHEGEEPTSTLLAPSLSDQLIHRSAKHEQKKLASDLRQLTSLLKWDNRTREFYLGSYRIRNCLSISTLGATYHAYDKQLDRDVALMLTYPRLTKNSQARLQLIESSRAVARVFHTNVASILGVVDFGELTGVLRQWVPGKSLAAWFQDRQHIQLKDVATIGSGIAEGLDAIHQEFVLHGDLKPGNIILRHGELEPVITDFGTATWMLPGRKATWMGGTPGFLAPEILRGESPTTASDLYSLGVILYWLAMGQLPEPKLSAREYLAKLTAIDATNSDIVAQRQNVAEVVMQLLEDRPECRPHHAREVAERLNNAAELASPLVIPSMRPIFSKTQKTRRAWLVHTAGLAATCAGTYEAVRRTALLSSETTNQPFVPGGSEDLRLLFQIDPESLDSSTACILIGEEKTPAPNFDALSTPSCNQIIYIGPRIANRWLEIVMKPQRLPDIPMRLGTVIGYYCFACPPGAAVYTIDVKLADSRSWRNIFWVQNYFGGWHNRMNEVALPQYCLVPGEQLCFRVRIKSSSPFDKQDVLPPVYMLRKESTEATALKSDLTARFWIQPSEPMDEKDA